MPSLGGTVRKIPAARVIATAELLLLARRHMLKLDLHERRRVVELVRRGRGRPGRLSERERRELSRLLYKAEPREFVVVAMKRVSGIPLPGSAGSRESR